MKIIRIIDGPHEADVDFHPDSALLLTGRPFFYPDFGGDWEGRLYLAVRINRLGKGVSLKFAPRYYDAITLALHIIPAGYTFEDYNDSPNKVIPRGILSGLDNSITHGEWMEMDKLNLLPDVSVNGIDRTLAIPSPDDISQAVSHVSVHTTIRTGDILLLPVDTAALPVKPRTRIAISNGSHTILNVKIV